MKKTEKENINQKVNDQIEILFDYELTEKQLEKIEKIGQKAKSGKATEKDLQVLKALENDLLDNELAENPSENKTAVKSFKWLKLENYKRQTLLNTNFNVVSKNDKIVFHYAKNVMKHLEKINYGYEYMDGKIDDITDINFDNNIDICTVIDIKDGEIKLKSDSLNGIYYLYVENFKSDKKSKICCNDDGIPFALYKKLA